MNNIIILLIFIYSTLSNAQLMDPRFIAISPPVVASEAKTSTPDINAETPAEELGGYYVKKQNFIKPTATDEYQLEVPKIKKENILKTKNKRSISNDENIKKVAVPRNEKDEPVLDSQNEDKNLSQQVKDIVLGGDLEKIVKERSHFEKNDIRKNIFDLSFGTFYFYNQSQSNFYYRNYLSASPGAFVALDLWVTPYLGFNANYKFTLLNSVKDSPYTESYASGNHDWLSFGLNFRRFFGSQFDTTSFTIGLNYVDKKFDVAASSNYRLKTRSRAPEIAIELSTPSSQYFLWNFGMSIQPYVLHDENTTTTAVRTGGSNQTMAFGAHVGGEYRMSRKMRTFFKFSTELYRSQFSGNATAADPITQQTPSNVVVNDVFYFFNIGLIFGK